VNRRIEVWRGIRRPAPGRYSGRLPIDQVGIASAGNHFATNALLEREDIVMVSNDFIPHLDFAHASPPETRRSRWKSAARALLALAPLVAATMAQAAPPWTVEGKLIGKPKDGGKQATDVSGLACAPAEGTTRLCLIVDDESQGAQVVILREGRLRAGERIRLSRATLDTSRSSSTPKASPGPTASSTSSARTAARATRTASPRRKSPRGRSPPATSTASTWRRRG
jgi:hypothetical protein